MIRRHPTSSPTLWSAIRCATWAWWRTSVCDEQAMPSASPTSPAWSATKCSAKGPGRIGRGLQGNCCLYPEVVTLGNSWLGGKRGLGPGSLPEQIPSSFQCENVSVENEKCSQVSLAKALHLTLLPVESVWPALIDCGYSGPLPGVAVWMWSSRC